MPPSCVRAAVGRTVGLMTTATATTTTTTGYLLGHDEAELRRLKEQARILAPATASLLTLAGIEPGMRVLDLGCGAGDVAFLVAGRVGPGGSVVGIDSSLTALDTARHRADRHKIGNVSFLEADVRTLDPTTDLAGPFDAVVGRLVLLYVDDPVDVVRRCATALRPGGVLLAMEYDMTAAGSLPAQPLPTQAMGWITAAFEWAGHDPALGCRLGGILCAAGLDGPVCLGLQSYLAPEDPAGPRLLASTARTLLPAIEAAGIASAAEVDIETLERRIADVQRATGAMSKPPALVGAWARRPHSQG
jgi:ubiquinone/menaquinone biosynthesis C-methylase UbiE